MAHVSGGSGTTESGGIKDSMVDICDKINYLLSPPSTVKTSSDSLLQSVIPLAENFVSTFETVTEQCKVAIRSEQYECIISNIKVLNEALSKINCTVTMVMKLFETDNCNHYRSSLCLLIESCFLVTKQTLSLCKEVESNHTHSIDNLAGTVGPIFKSGFILLKTCSESIEYVCRPNPSNEQHHTLLIRVLTAMVDVSQFVLSFDPSLILLSWKALGKFICHMKDRAQLLDSSQLKLVSVINGMCEAMLAKSTECVNSAHHCDKEGNIQYSKLLKMCRFFATMIAKVVKEYSDFHYALAADMVEFLLQLYEILPPSLSCATLNTAQLSDIEANISVLIEPLVVSMLNCEQFLHHLTSFSFKKAACRSYLPDVLLLCLVLKNYNRLNESNRQFLIEHTSSQCNKLSSCRVLDAVFKCIKECSTELSLPVYVPGVATGGNASCHVTLYEHIATHLCSVIAVLSPAQFIIVEQCLFQQLLFNSDFYCSLLVQDIWCFVARWGTSSLCYSHIKSLIKLIFAVGDKLGQTSMKVKYMLSRLIAFTTPAQQCNLLGQYPPNVPENLLIWSCVPYTSLDPSVISEVCRVVYTTSCQLLLSPSVTPLTNYYCIQCLSGLLSETNLKPHLPTLTPQLLQHVIHMLNGITVIKFKDNGIHQLIATSLLELISSLISQFSSLRLLEVFNGLYTICTTTPCLPEDVLVGVAHVLKQCSSLNTTNTDVLRLLCACFKSLISHTRSWLVHNKALDAFKYFAEVTPHADILEGCIPSCLNDTVVKYLQKISLEGSNDFPMMFSKLMTSNSPLQNPDVIILNDEEEEIRAKPKCSPFVMKLMDQWEMVKSNHESMTVADKQQLTVLNRELSSYTV